MRTRKTYYIIIYKNTLKFIPETVSHSISNHYYCNNYVSRKINWANIIRAFFLYLSMSSYDTTYIFLEHFNPEGNMPYYVRVSVRLQY